MKLVTGDPRQLTVISQCLRLVTSKNLMLMLVQATSLLMCDLQSIIWARADTNFSTLLGWLSPKVQPEAPAIQKDTQAAILGRQPQGENKESLPYAVSC